MADGGGINLRIALKGADQVKAELNQIGPAGQAMARQIDGAMRTPSMTMRAMDTAAAQARGGIMNLAASGGGLSSALSTLGPVGLAAGAGLAAAGLAATATFRAFQETAQAADALVAAADKIGVGVEGLQSLRFAAEETDVEVSSLESGLQKLNGTLGAMQTGLGDSKVKGAFAALKISRSDLAGLNDAGDLLPIIADRIAKIDSQAGRVQLLKKLGIAELEPMLRDGAKGLEDYEAKAKSLGIGLSEELATGLADANRELEISGDRVDSAVAKMQGALAPFFVWIAEKTSAAIVGLVNLLTFSDSERLQGLIDQRARIERGQARHPGRPMDARTQGIYDTAGSDAQKIIAERERRRQEALARAKPESEPDIDLSGGGGGGGSGSAQAAADRRKADEERRADEAARRLEQVDEALYRARADELSSAIDSATTLEQRRVLELQRLDVEQQRARTEQTAFIAEGAIDAAKADELKAALARTQATERAVLIQRQRVDSQNALRTAEQAQEGMLLDILSAASEQARTAGEKRDIELRILAIAQDRFRAELQDKIATAETAEAKARYSVMLAQLPDREAAQRTQVLSKSAGPIEQWRNAQPRDAAEASERVTGEALDALDNLNDGLIDAWKNADNAGEAFSNMGRVAVDALGQVADALMKIALQRMLIEPLGNALFGGGQAGGSQGLLGSFISNFTGQVFGAQGGTSSSAASTSAVSNLSANLARAVPRAAGGLSGASGLHRVGEFGLELLELPAGSRIYDTDRSQRMLSDFENRMSSGERDSVGGVSVNMPVTVVNNSSAQVAASPRRAAGGGIEIMLSDMIDSRVQSMGANGKLAGALGKTPQPRRR